VTNKEGGERFWENVGKDLPKNVKTTFLTWQGLRGRKQKEGETYRRGRKGTFHLHL